MAGTINVQERIHARRTQAEMLLSLASHDTANEQVRLSLRDLDEALAWLQRRPTAGSIQLLLELATWRLNTVREMLRSGGPDARG
jgi:hypothetical protein